MSKEYTFQSTVDLYRPSGLLEVRCMAIHVSVHLLLHLVHGTPSRRMADFRLGGISKDIVGSSRACANSDEELVTSDGSCRLDYSFLLITGRCLVTILRGLKEHIRAFSMR
jgi:hypothetical protein